MVENSFDTIIHHIGDFGTYQRKLFILLLVPGMLCAMHKFSWVFLGAYAEHRCLLPWEHANNATFNKIILSNNTIKLWNEEWDKCEPLELNNNSECTQWIFNKELYQSSAVFEFQLVCSWEWARGTAHTALVLGGVIGALIFGNLSDRLGRKPVFISCMILQLCMGILASFAPYYWTYLVARFFLGASIPGVYIPSYVLCMELVSADRRQFVSVIMQIIYTLGYLLTALFAYLITEWRNLQLVVSLPGLICIVYWWLINESPRWLIGQGRIEDASIILQEAGKINKNFINNETTEKEFIEKLNKLINKAPENTDNNNNEKSSLLHMLIYYTKLRYRTLIIFFLWFVNGVSYFGLSWNTGDLAGNDYINFTLSGLVELPAHLMVLFIGNYKGRIFIQSISLYLSVIFLLLITITPQDISWLLTTIALIGKFTVTGSYASTYLLSSELLPTSVRTSGMGACATMGALGAIVASFIMLFSNYWIKLPYFLLAILTLLAGILSKFLPETLNKDLPDTLQAGENFFDV